MQSGALMNYETESEQEKMWGKNEVGETLSIVGNGEWAMSNSWRENAIRDRESEL
jgi:hypothetical protein